MAPFLPLGRTVAQLRDPVFVSVMLRSVVYATFCFVVLAMAIGWGTAHYLLSAGVWPGVLGTAVALIAALFLFLPLAMMIAALMMDSIAQAVETRYYPSLAPSAASPWAAQLRDGFALAWRVVALNVLAFFLAFLVPGLGLVLGWMIAAWAIGRGFFMAVAMRRMSWFAAQDVYRRNRGPILFQGVLLAVMGAVPVLNLLVPVMGTAMMVHVLMQLNHARVD